MSNTTNPPEPTVAELQEAAMGPYASTALAQLSAKYNGTFDYNAWQAQFDAINLDKQNGTYNQRSEELYGDDTTYYWVDEQYAKGDVLNYWKSNTPSETPNPAYSVTLATPLPPDPVAVDNTNTYVLGFIGSLALLAFVL
jgi:hypothetical protein